ncbi:TniQ family protein [Streptomyces sp. NPDC085639]|uniref:TniQ family protein n=1 Tax=Streptomyces sp. NPDC085639 TaxID=3365734 RepID=UPI0037D2B078
MKLALPRSLAPAPGELLPGYLLRVSHRIGIAPGDLAHRCGLTQGNRLPTHPLVCLDADQARRIAAVCRLEPAEVHHLTLAGQAPGYSPLGAVYLGQPQSPVDMANSGWVFTAFSRFCSDCLAESADQPGGPVWQGSWRLPHTFLCVRHNRYLSWRCPACGAPAFSNGYRPDGRWRSSQLIPGRRARLHPGQCRHRPAGGWDTPCSARLDREVPAAAPTAAAILAQRLLHAASADLGNALTSLGEPASPEQFFNDVRTVVLAICCTWPTAADAFPAFDGLDLIGAHAASLRRTPADRLKPQRNGWLARSIDHPPADAPQSAAFMSLVVHILDNPDGTSPLARMLSRLPAGRASEVAHTSLLTADGRRDRGGKSHSAGSLRAARPLSASPHPLWSLRPAQHLRAPARRVDDAVGAAAGAQAVSAARRRDPSRPDGPRRITAQRRPLPWYPAWNSAVHHPPRPHLAEAARQRGHVPGCAARHRADRHEYQRSGTGALTIPEERARRFWGIALGW